MNRRDFLRSAGIAIASTSLAPKLALAADDTSTVKSAKNYKIAFSHPVSEAPVVTAIRRFSAQRAKELGVTVLNDNTKSGQVESQVATIETWITQGVDAICVLPLAPTALTGLQAKAKQKGILWTTYALPMDGQDGELAWDNKESGRLIGEHCAPLDRSEQAGLRSADPDAQGLARRVWPH